MFLDAQMHEFLLTLDRAALDDEPWVPSSSLRHIPTKTRSDAQHMGWVNGQGRTSLRQYQITAEGRTALANNAEANLKVMDKLRKGFVPTGDSPLGIVPRNGAGFIQQLNGGYPATHALEKVDVPQAVQKNNQAAVAPSLDPRARACVQAIDILSEDWPEVGDLVDALMKLNARKGSAHE